MPISSLPPQPSLPVTKIELCHFETHEFLPEIRHIIFPARCRSRGARGVKSSLPIFSARFLQRKALTTRSRR